MCLQSEEKLCYSEATSCNRRLRGSGIYNNSWTTYIKWCNCMWLFARNHLSVEDPQSDNCFESSVITPIEVNARFNNFSIFCYACQNVYVIFPRNKWLSNCNSFFIHRWILTSLINTPLGCQHLRRSRSIRLSLWCTSFLSLTQSFTFS